MKQTIIAIGAALCIGASAPAFSQGIPTMAGLTDIQLIMQLQQMYKDYEVYKGTWDTMKQQYAAVTGSRGFGNVLLQEAINASSVVPGSWQEVVANQGKGLYGSTQDRYMRLLRTMPQELFAPGQQAENYKLSTDSVLAAFSGGEVLYAQVQRHLNTIATLAQRVESTPDIKASSDLNNRIQSEKGMLETAMAKLQVMNMNLQANLVNQQNQAKAATHRYFRRPAPTNPG